MPSSKDSGIFIEWINLLSCEVKAAPQSPALAYHLAITDFSRKLSGDGKHLFLAVSFDLMHGVKNPPCEFRCTFGAAYSRGPDAEMTWDEFKDHLAIAHLIPYLREFISNLTARLPLALLIIPPINAHNLLEGYRQLRLELEAATSPALKTEG